MSTIPQFALMICLVLAFGFTSCDNDDVEPIDPDAPIELGEFYLLESTLDKFPYNSEGKAIYVNAEGDEATFWIDREPIWNYTEERRMDVIFENGEAADTLYYNYSSQNLRSSLRSTKLGIEFKVEVGTVLWPSDLASGSIADILVVSCQGYSLFSHVADQRTWPEQFEWSTEPDTVTFLGRTFSDAMTDARPPFSGQPLAYPWFNYEEGIISFHDKDSTLWRFERFER